jgi:hypothetical protein
MFPRRRQATGIGQGRISGTMLAAALLPLAPFMVRFPLAANFAAGAALFGRGVKK